MLERKKGFVSVWGGSGISKQMLDEYAVNEHYEEDESVPINQFAKDANDTFYDHDFLVAFHTRAKKKSVSQILDDCDGKDFFIDQLQKDIESKKLINPNCFIFLYDQALTPTRWPTKSPFEYLGTYPYQPISDKPEKPELRNDDHKGTVSQISISPGGTYAVSVGHDKTFRLWRLKDATFIAKKNCTAPEIVGWLADDQLVTEEGESLKGKGFAIWTIRDDKVKKKVLKTKLGYHRPVVSRELQAIFWVHKKPVIGYVDQWNPTESPYNANNPTQSIIELPNARCAVVDTEDNVSVWDLKTMKETKGAKVDDTTIGCPLANDRFATTSGIFSAKTAKKLKSLKESHALGDTAAVIDPCEDIFAGIAFGSLVVWNGQNGKIVCNIEIDEEETQGCFAAQANLAFTASCDANVHAFELKKGKNIATWRIAPTNRSVESDMFDYDGYELTSIAAAPDGTRVIVGEESGRVHILAFNKNKFEQLR